MKYIAAFLLIICASVNLGFRETGGGKPRPSAYVYPSLKDKNQFVSDVFKIKGFKRSIDLAKKNGYLYNYRYDFFLNKDGKIKPHVYYVTDTQIFGAIREFVDTKFNKYKWLPAKGKRGWLKDEAYIELYFSNSPNYDTIRVTISEPSEFDAPRKKLYEVVVPYKKLKY